MAISRMYQKAKEMRSLADQLQKEESLNAQKKISHQLEIELEKLKKNQKKEINSHDEHKEKVLRNLNLEMEKQINPINTAIQQMKAKKGPPRKLLPNSNTPRNEIENINTSKNKPKPIYNLLRNKKSPIKLDIQPINNPIPLKKSTSRN